MNLLSFHDARLTTVDQHLWRPSSAQPIAAVRNKPIFAPRSIFRESARQQADFGRNLQDIVPGFVAFRSNPAHRDAAPRAMNARAGCRSPQEMQNQNEFRAFPMVRQGAAGLIFSVS